jgi:hypothetical protein
MNQNQISSKPADAEQESGKGLDGTTCSAKYALSVAMEHLACGKYPRQNWGQFLALVKSANIFTDDEIARWHKIYSMPNNQAQE